MEKGLNMRNELSFTKVTLDDDYLEKTIEKFSSAIEDQGINGDSASLEIFISMSPVRFILITCMITLIQFVESYLNKNRNTHFIFDLPRPISPGESEFRVRKVISFMYAWRFPKVVSEVIGIDFQFLLNKESFDYISSIDDDLQHNIGNFYDTYKYFNDLSKLTERSIRSLFHQGLFCVRRYPANRQNLLFEFDRWTDPRIEFILRSCTQRYKPLSITQSIISEALSNILHHPNATFFTACALFRESAKHLTISYWDNGESIIQTINSAIDKGHDVFVKERENVTWLVITGNGNSKGTSIFKSCSFNKETVISDIVLCLYAISPGISRIASDPIKLNNKLIAGNGVGLYKSIKATTDLGGSVTLRTRRYLINISSIDDKDLRQKRIVHELLQAGLDSQEVIKVRIQDNYSMFLGNQITYRIPVN